MKSWVSNYIPDFFRPKPPKLPAPARRAPRTDRIAALARDLDIFKGQVGANLVSIQEDRMKRFERIESIARESSGNLGDLQADIDELKRAYRSRAKNDEWEHAMRRISATEEVLDVIAKRLNANHRASKIVLPWRKNG